MKNAQIFKFTIGAEILFLLTYFCSIFFYFAVSGKLLPIVFFVAALVFLSGYCCIFLRFLTTINLKILYWLCAEIIVCGFFTVFFIGKENGFIAEYYFFIMIYLILLKSLLLSKFKKKLIFFLLPMILIVLVGLM